MKDVFDWLSAGGEVAVFDATNTTRFEEERKANTIEFIKPLSGKEGSYSIPKW